MKSNTKCYLKVIKNAYADVLKQNHFKAAHRESTLVKKSPENYHSLHSPCKRTLPNIKQLRFLGVLNQKRKVNNFTQTSDYSLIRCGVFRK